MGIFFLTKIDIFIILLPGLNNQFQTHEFWISRFKEIIWLVSSYENTIVNKQIRLVKLGRVGQKVRENSGL